MPEGRSLGLDLGPESEMQWMDQVMIQAEALGWLVKLQIFH
jgi:hypothetical protein